MPLDKEKAKRKIELALRLGKKRNFLESVDATIVLKGIDLKSPEARIREIVYLPNKPNKDVKICVVAEGDLALKAKQLGLEVYGRQDIQGIEKKEAKRIAQKCDWVLVQVQLMGLAGKFLGPALGPRGKVPTPLPPNVNLDDFIERYKRAVMVRIKGQPQISVRIGTEDMEPEKLVENLQAVYNVVEQKLGPQTISKVIVKKTMGVPVEV
jgi:large subunit ribosomal protein L1